MSNNEKEAMFCGSGNEYKPGYFSIDLNLTQLWKLTKGVASGLIKKYTSKIDGEQSTIRINLVPLRPENRNKYKTHFLVIDQFKKDEETSKDAANSSSDIPF